MQARLTELGYDTKGADGKFGPRTREAVIAYQTDHKLSVDGTVGPATWSALHEAQAPRNKPAFTPGGVPILERYPPGAEVTKRLFREAATLIGVPQRWADSKALENILRRESNGVVGRPNYTYGERASNRAQWNSIHEELRAGARKTKSSATGLGQLLLSNVDRYYPDGRAGIGDPLNEAAGMLAYIKDRYKTPEKAWSLYNVLHEGY